MLLLALLGAWVLGARPRETENQALALVLLLFAGSTLAFWGVRATDDPIHRRDLLRLIYWLELPAFLLIALALERLFLERRRSIWRQGSFVLATVVVVSMLASLVLWTDLWFRPDVSVPPGSWSFTLSNAYGILGYGINAGAIIFSIFVIRDETRPHLERQQAAAIGLAFAALAGHTGATTIVRLATTDAPMALGLTLVRIASLAGLGAVLYGARDLADPFEGPGRRLARLVIGSPVVAGAIDASRRTLLPMLGIEFPVGYRNTRPIWLATFAICLAVAVVRFGLGGFHERSRDRMATAGTGVLLATLGGLTIWVLRTTVTNDLRIQVGLGIVAALAVAYRPVRSLHEVFLEKLVSDPSEPSVLQARHRAYKAALTGSVVDGEPTPEGEQILERLRRELHISAQDHLLLRSEIEEEVDHSDELLLGRYTIETQISTGARGNVYLGRDGTTGRHVVVKRVHAADEGAGIDPRLLDRWKRIDHPHVRAIERAEPVDQGWILILEHVSGTSLEERLARGPLSPSEAVDRTLEVLAGLQVLHGQNIVHGDLKAANILVDEDGSARVADLGSARLTDLPPDETQPIRTSKGTFTAMAPEEVNGEAPTVQSDVYAVGALLYRMHAGEHYAPFHDLDSASIREAIRRKPPDLEDARVPSELLPLLETALAKDPGDRFEDSLAFAAALQQATDRQGLEGRSPSIEGLGYLEDQA